MTAGSLIPANSLATRPGTASCRAANSAPSVDMTSATCPAKINSPRFTEFSSAILSACSFARRSRWEPGGSRRAITQGTADDNSISTAWPRPRPRLHGSPASIHCVTAAGETRQSFANSDALHVGQIIRIFPRGFPVAVRKTL